MYDGDLPQSRIVLILQLVLRAWQIPMRLPVGGHGYALVRFRLLLQRAL